MDILEITKPLVSTSWLAQHLNHPDLVVLDASMKKVSTTASEMNESNALKIKNARIFDVKNTFSDTTSGLPNTMPSAALFSKETRALGIRKDSLIVVYDTLGIYSSPRVWWMFRAMGHTNVAVLDGGFPAWKKANLPTEPITTETIKTGDFEADFDSKKMVGIPEVLKAITDSNTIIMDARSPDRFEGKTPEPRAGLRSGHIPSAINMHYETVLHDGKMRSEAELKTLFERLNVSAKSLVFSCGSGITACILGLAAQRAGYEQYQIYDGSWTEWGSRSDLPIAP